MIYACARRKQVSLSELAVESGPVGIAFGTDFRKTYVAKGRKTDASFRMFLVGTARYLTEANGNSA